MSREQSANVDLKCVKEKPEKMSEMRNWQLRNPNVMMLYSVLFECVVLLPHTQISKFSQTPTVCSTWVLWVESYKMRVQQGSECVRYILSNNEVMHNIHIRLFLRKPRVNIQMVNLVLLRCRSTKTSLQHDTLFPQNHRSLWEGTHTHTHTRPMAAELVPDLGGNDEYLLNSQRASPIQTHTRKIRLRRSNCDILYATAAFNSRFIIVSMCPTRLHSSEWVVYIMIKLL